MLAEAFCLADERVEAARAALEEAQTERTRVLAALSVTVGSDGAVAQLLGLAERSVRLSRRRIGRAAARQIAEAILAGPDYDESAEGEPPQDGTWTAQRDGSSPQPAPPPQQPPPAPEPCPVPNVPPAPAEPAWPPAMDQLLLQGWASGVDQQALAGQLGIDLATLVGRVQQLTTRGDRARRFSHIPAARQPADATPPGRHRRTTDHRSPFTGAFGPPAPDHPDHALQHPDVNGTVVDGRFGAA
ncbi:hypothetical protein GCM10027168_43790 [Streptomyces capparidis]